MNRAISPTGDDETYKCIQAANARLRDGHFAQAKTMTLEKVTAFRPAVQASLGENFVSLIAGGVAGTVSASLMSPIDVVRTHLQASTGSSQAAARLASGSLKRAGAMDIAKNIARLEGARGFFRGLGPTLVGMLPHRSTQFWAYSTSRDLLSQKFGHSSWVDMVSGGVSGMVANTVTNPIWLVKARMQLQAGGDVMKNPRLYRGYGDAIVRIFKEEGIRGFYKGVTASYWGVSEAAIHFVVYERIKRKIRESNMKQAQARGNYKEGSDEYQISSVQTLFAAAFSKCVASIITYPHEVVRTRMREQPKFIGSPSKYRGMIQSLRIIAREEGRRGLYAGMGAHLAKTVPNAAILFFTYETIKRWVKRRDERIAATPIGAKS